MLLWVAKRVKLQPVLKRAEPERISSWREEDQGDGDEQMAALEGRAWRRRQWEHRDGKRVSGVPSRLCRCSGWLQQVLQLLVFPSKWWSRSRPFWFQPSTTEVSSSWRAVGTSSWEPECVWTTWLSLTPPLHPEKGDFPGSEGRAVKRALCWLQHVFFLHQFCVECVEWGCRKAAFLKKNNKKKNLLFYIGEYLINSVGIISGGQQRGSAIHIQVSVIPQTPLPSRPKGSLLKTEIWRSEAERSQMNLIFLFRISFQKKQMFSPSLICKKDLIIMINNNNKHVNEFSWALGDDTWKALEQVSLGGDCY